MRLGIAICSEELAPNEIVRGAEALTSRETSCLAFPAVRVCDAAQEAATESKTYTA